MLLIWIAVNTFDYLETFPKGGLKNESGILSIQKVKNKNILIFTGNAQNGICTFYRCLKEELTSVYKQNATVKLDEVNRIFEISVEGTIIFGKKDTETERNEYAFRVLICLVFFIVYLTFFALKRKNREGSAWN